MCKFKTLSRCDVLWVVHNEMHHRIGAIRQISRCKVHLLSRAFGATNLCNMLRDLMPLSFFLVACSASTTVVPDATVGVVLDVMEQDAVLKDDAMASDVVDVRTVDVAPSRRCGVERPLLSEIGASAGVVIASNGTMYYAQNGSVGRYRSGNAPQNSWVRIPGLAGAAVWGLALDVVRNRLYVGTNGSGIFLMDLTVETIPPTRFSPATVANGLTMGPDGDLYYTDFRNDVWHVDQTGSQTRVNTAPIAGASGLAFGPDGSLYVNSSRVGVVWRLTLANGVQTAGEMFASGLRSPDGIALDAVGNLYVTEQGASSQSGRLVRIAPGGTTESLTTGLSAPTKIEFGVGSLPCTDVYVATGTGLVRFENTTISGATVPWHR
jgi:sugar lactone lactonase YvrE